MKKIWIGGSASCGVHNEKSMLWNYIINHGFELTDNVTIADVLIVVDTCLGTYNNFTASMDYILELLKVMKKDAEVIVSGCLTRGVTFQLTEEQNEILKKVKLVKQEELVAYIAKLLTGKITKKELVVPHTIENYTMKVSPVSGCLNHCSFCKTNYTHFDLKSHPFETIESFASEFEKNNIPFYRVNLFSSNLSLYGQDLYGKKRAHEIIKKFTEPDQIKFAYTGALINWYPELVYEIINNQKIKAIFTSLESGSPRVYKLMNRPISLKNLIRVIKFIKKERPDIIIFTEFIAGFPTETMNDLKRTINLAYELDVYPLFVYDYQNSKQIPASRLKQHSKEDCQKATYYAANQLLPLREKFDKIIENRELVIVEKYEKEKNYTGLLIDGSICNISFDQLDGKYQVGDILPADSVKIKQLSKR